MARFDKIGDLLPAVVAEMSPELRAEVDAALAVPELTSACEIAETLVDVTND